MPEQSSPERNLLFAGLGLQLSLLTKEQLVRAFSEWILNKNQSLSEILVQQKAITPEQQKAIEGAVEAQIENDGGEVQALASVKNAQEIETSLKGMADEELQMTICNMHALQSRKIVGNEFTIPPGLQQPMPGKKPLDQRFQRKHFLDAGNLGEIWFAKDEELNRTVVLKFIKPEQQSSPFSKALFTLEGEVTGYLEHPAVVPVYSMGQDNKERSFYAMRYIRGRKLTRAIADYQALPASAIGKRREALTELLQMFQTACLAIEYAHSKGVLHCDLKPDNIVVGQFGETLVIDWGLAMVTNPTSELSKEMQTLEHMPMSTASGDAAGPYSPSESARPGLHSSQGGMRKFVGGTPAYIAPEQMRATRGGEVKEVTHACDIFSLGATLYHLLAGQAPYFPDKEKREGNEEFFKRVEKGDYPQPSQLTPGISKPLEAIVLKAMAASPGDRYGSARELAEEVRRWLADEPVHAYKENAWERTRRWARNNRTVVVAGIVLMGCLGIGGAGFGLVTQGFNVKLRKQESIANDQRDLAQKREAMAIASVKQYAEAVEKNPDLKNRPELESLRKELLKEPIHFFKELSDQLRSEKSPSTKSLNDLAAGLNSLANLTEEIGNQEDAILSYKEAVTIMETMIKADPTNSEFQNNLASSIHNLGSLHRVTNRVNEAEVSLQKALAMREGLVKDNPTNSGYQANLARSYNELANLFFKSNRLKEAEEGFQKTLAIYGALVKDNPTNSAFKYYLAAFQNNLALLFRQTSRIKEAEEGFQKALAILEALVKSNPTNSDFQSVLANSHSNLGDLYRDTNRHKEAEESYQKNLAIMETLVKANPTNSRFQSVLAHSYLGFAFFYDFKKRPKEAEGSYQKAVAVLEPLVIANPVNSDYQFHLAYTYSGLANLFFDTNRLKEAEASFQKANVIQKTLVQANPRNSAFQNDLAYSHYNLANLFLETDRHKEAEKGYNNALALWESLEKSNTVPTNHEFKKGMARIKNNFAVLRKRQALKLVSLPDMKSEDYQKGLLFVQEAIKLLPQEAELLNTLGVAQYRVKQFAAALDTLQKSNEYNSKTSGKEDPGDLAFLAMTCHQLNKKAEAENYFKKLQEAMQDKKNSENKEYQGFFKEAEALLKK